MTARVVGRAAVVLVVLSGLAFPPADAGRRERKANARVLSVDEIVARHVEAIGGREAFLAPAGRTVTGRFEMPGPGITGSVKVITAPPDRFLMSLQIPGMGTVRQGFDGEVAWAINPMIGPMLLDGPMYAQIADQAAWDAGLFPAARFQVRERVGREDFEGSPAWKVHMVSRRGVETWEYFDVRSGLHVGTEGTVDTPMGSVRTRAVLFDYREVDGVKMPMRMEQDLGPQGKQVFVIEDVSTAPVPDEAFELPPAIRTLVEAAAESDPAAD